MAIVAEHGSEYQGIDPPSDVLLTKINIFVFGNFINIILPLIPDRKKILKTKLKKKLFRSLSHKIPTI